jgi:hypothetical protein
MANSVTFKRDYYPILVASWIICFWGAGLTLLAKSLVPYPVPVFNFILVLAGFSFLVGILALIFERSKIISIDQNGLRLYAATLFPSSEFFIDWKDIKRADIANRETHYITFFRAFPPIRKMSQDTLVIYLKSYLDPVKSSRFENENSSFFSSNQSMFNKEKNEVWITHPPRGGFQAVLKELSKYIEIPGFNYNAEEEASITRLSNLMANLILLSGFLLFLYLMIF